MKNKKDILLKMHFKIDLKKSIHLNRNKKNSILRKTLLFIILQFLYLYKYHIILIFYFLLFLFKPFSNKIDKNLTKFCNV